MMYRLGYVESTEPFRVHRIECEHIQNILSQIRISNNQHARRVCSGLQPVHLLRAKDIDNSLAPDGTVIKSVRPRDFKLAVDERLHQIDVRLADILSVVQHGK